MLSDESRAEIIELVSQTAVVAGELYGALLAVQVPDHADRGTKNFTHNQAFELTRTLLANAVNESGV